METDDKLEREGGRDFKGGLMGNETKVTVGRCFINQGVTKVFVYNLVFVRLETKELKYVFEI